MLRRIIKSDYKLLIIVYKMESYERREYSVGGNFNNALKYQMSAVVAMIAARKVRLSLTDQSGLVLQSLSQFSERPNPDQSHPVFNSGKRFSITTDELEETANSYGALPTFDSTITQSALMLTNHGRLTADMSSNKTSDNFQVAHTISKTTVDNAAKKRALPRVKSSPHLTVLSSFLGSPQKNSSEVSDSTSQSIQRRHSHSNLLDVSDYKAEVIGDTVNKEVIMPHSPLPSDAQKPIESNLSGTNSYGFGILSRTRQFGAWLTKAVDGEKLEVTKKDLNALAPSTF